MRKGRIWHSFIQCLALIAQVTWSPRRGRPCWPFSDASNKTWNNGPSHLAQVQGVLIRREFVNWLYMDPWPENGIIIESKQN